MMISGVRIKSMIISLFVLIIPVLASSEGKEFKTTTSHGISLFGGLKYGPDFKHFDYVNPDAPKGGVYTTASMMATFDSLNPYIILGTPIILDTPFTGAGLNETLMVRSGDEPTSLYGLIAESITLPEDYSWVEFKIRDIARWQDGKPITVEDIIFTYNILLTKGRPVYRNTYSHITKAEKTGPLSVRFYFDTKGDKRKAYNIANLTPVLPKHYWEGREFDKPSLDIPLTSSAYKITRVVPGRSLTQELDENYWGKDLPVNRGRNNFKIRQTDYYRDLYIAFESFIAGGADHRMEISQDQWEKSYNIDAYKDGYLIKDYVKTKGVKTYMGIFFNLRREKFKDPRVREALSYAYDFDWINKNIYYGKQTRFRSYFDGCELAATGLPGPAELELLEPYRDELDPRVFTEEYQPPDTDATYKSLRKNLQISAKLLKEAGYTVKGDKLYSKDGEHFEIEFMIIDPSVSNFYNSYIKDLKRLGITARLRILDTPQFMQKYRSFNYDMLANTGGLNDMSPGSDLLHYYGSEAADDEGGLNTGGIQSKAIDGLIEKAIFAPDRTSKVVAINALDRILTWGFYSVPMSYREKQMIAYWNRFGRPGIQPDWVPDLYLRLWWIDEKKDMELRKYRGKISGQ
ncbi:extracellular solute-binding protein [Thermodesulfobacteriota bacterium]